MIQTKTIENLVTDNAKVVLDHQTSSLHVSLSGFIPFKQMESIIHHEFEMIRFFQLSKCLIDLRGIKVYAPGTPELIQTVWFPRVKEEGVQYIAFVVPEDVFGQASMNKAHDESDKKENINVKYFKDLISAKKWLMQPS
uniref:STAS/SEC14 domain-containing protein n=1 Tax=Roseihalotalea indica TaxID=2867963 RepID=A0AA49GL66_9BACT|nr:hypothetical protein K4G66_27740 [Tunicatimonas sp. TK19036]